MALEPRSGGVRRRTRVAEEVKAPVPEAEVPRAIAYLWENIQDLRNEVREVRRLTVGSYEKLDVKIEELRKEMDAKIERLYREMAVEFRWMLGSTVVAGGLIVAALKFLA